MILTEGEILMDDKFITRVNLPVAPYRPAAYEASRAGVQREIWRLEEKMQKHYDPDALEVMQKQVEKLNQIIKDLNRILFVV